MGYSLGTENLYLLPRQPRLTEQPSASSRLGDREGTERGLKGHQGECCQEAAAPRLLDPGEQPSAPSSARVLGARGFPRSLCLGHASLWLQSKQEAGQPDS